MDIPGLISGAAARGRVGGRRRGGRVRASAAGRGRATFPVEVRFRRESDDVETAVATYRMALLRS
jgi:hypothetical protein